MKRIMILALALFSITSYAHEICGNITSLGGSTSNGKIKLGIDSKEFVGQNGEGVISVAGVALSLNRPVCITLFPDGTIKSVLVKL